MYPFSPRAFVVFSKRLLALSALHIAKDVSFSDPRIASITEDLPLMANEARRLGLPLSALQAERVLELFLLQDRDALSRASEDLDSRILDELSQKMCYVITQEKISYTSRNWIANQLILDAFPTSVSEFDRAGRCFAFSENTACVFHLMRIVDLGLKCVAASLDISYEARNWSGIADKISKLMEQKYQLKTNEWKKKEPFYASVLTDIQAISKGYRNETLHDVTKVYEESDAYYLLKMVEHFIINLAKNGMTEWS